ncbi:hypothetical protein [Arcobacter arenosus]|uniref:hypothetical protein n=1 Tax=Arcobacter arenosus TaxID=2576037 RepID=UPI003BA9B349
MKFYVKTIILICLVSFTFNGCISSRQYKELTRGGYSYTTEIKHYSKSTHEYKIEKIGYKSDLKGKVRELEFQFLVKTTTSSYDRKWKRNNQHPDVGHYSGRSYNHKTVYGDWEPLRNKKISITELSKHIVIDDDSILTTDSDGKIKIIANIVYDYVYFAGIKGNLKSLKLDKKLFSDKYSKQETVGGFKIKYDTKAHTVNFRIIDTREAMNNIVQEKIGLIFEKKFNNVNIVVEDIDTRYELKNPDIIIQGRPPKLSDILKPYFKNKEYLNIAIEKFPDFVNGEKTGSSFTTFPLYIGWNYNLIVKHPLYNYLEKKIKIMPNTKKITVRMSELGSKHRVKIVEQ